MVETKTFVVSGVTGRQGGASARHLLAAGHRVKGLTHTPSKVERIARMGAEPIVADLRDPSSLISHLKGVDGFHIVTDPFARSKETDDWGVWVEDEIRQGVAALRAAQSASVPHVILGSVAQIAQMRGIPLHATKAVVESFARRWNLPHTITRPPFFLDDWVQPENWGLDWRESGVIKAAVPADAPLPQIATDDIGRVVAWAFNHPDRSIGRVWELVGEVTTYPAIGQTLSRFWGRPMRFEELPASEGDALDRILREGGLPKDVASFEREFGFRMTTFDQFVDRLLASTDSAPTPDHSTE